MLDGDLRRRYLMDWVKIDLKNCYGIKSLENDLDFRKTCAYAIYAPNGVMKSSLAQTFQDAASGEKSEDRIFRARKTSRKITDQSNKEIEGERILVVLPYDPDYGPTEKTATLLVDTKLRNEYEQLHVAIDVAKANLLKAVQQQAHSKAKFEAEIISAFTSGDTFEIAVTRIRDELSKQKETPFADVQYDVIFDAKVLKALDTTDLKSAMENYVKRYNEILAASTYFKKGTFDYYNAGQIAKSLADNGFFNAKHSVNLKASVGVLEISTQIELENVISREKESILKDKELRNKFDAIAKQLERNSELRQFYRYLQNNEELLSRMNDVAKFKEDVLKSYIKAHYELYEQLMEKYDAALDRKKEIEDEARKQRTQWEEVIAIFNDRFFVPFRLEAKNRVEVMLGHDAIIDLGFTYIDGNDTANVEKSALLKVLSTGERKALYILNIIFEVQRRRATNTETLIVVDDIADSYDYQNKYAIIQYLKDISEDGLFKLIIMTHNFDFFRTIEGRFIGYSNCLMASKNEVCVSLIPATGIKNVFANDWKKYFFTDSKKKIASIAFLRNLIEMTSGESHKYYCQLNSMLHWRPNSSAIMIADLDAIYRDICKIDGISDNASRSVWDVMVEEAKTCLGASDGLKLENKIVLAMATRIATERFMIRRIADDAFIAGLTANQTQALIKKFKQKFPGEDDAIRVLDRVALMTPENIHVNAFMYEPIVDMSEEHLKRLYTEVISLGDHAEEAKVHG